VGREPGVLDVLGALLDGTPRPTYCVIDGLNDLCATVTDGNSV
jgi:hypothetical protein